MHSVLARVIRSLAATVIAASCVVAASAQTSNVAAYPARAVEVYVGYPAGTGSDSIARFFAERLQKSTGQPFIVVNKPGLYGQLAANEIKTSKSDGYTLLITPNSTLTVNPYLVPNNQFDASRDLSSVTTLARWGLVLLVNPERTPVKSVSELTALLKSEPHRHNFASGHYAGRAAGELYKLRTGVDVVHVAYRGVPAALTDLIGGQVDFLFADAVAGLPQVRSGRLRALAVTGQRRIDAIPDIPTMVEAGVSDFDVTSWFGVLMPPGASPQLRQRVSELFNQVLAEPETRDFYARISAEPFPGNPSSLTELIGRETTLQGQFIKSVGIDKFE